MNCFDVEETCIFLAEGEKHLPFFSYTTKHIFAFCTHRSFCHQSRSICLYSMLWWWWSYECINECVWMQWMMWCIVQMNVQTHASEATPRLCIPLGTTLGSSSPFIFRCSPFIFWCKFCVPLGMTFELLRLLFRRYKFCIPLGTTFELLRLIFRWYLALHSLRNDFWAEKLRCAPLGTTFCSFVVLSSSPWGRLLSFSAFPLFFSLHAMVHAQILHFTFFWGIWLSWS
jgi:hypothetical protein